MNRTQDWPVIFRALVGSRAYGLHRPDSDVDTRDIFYIPTKHLLDFNFKHKVSWMEIDDDGNDGGGYEIAEMFSHVMYGKPNTVELLFANGLYLVPSQTQEEENRAVIEAGRSLLNASAIRKAFAGYAGNGFKKIEDKNPAKWKTGSLRAAHQGLILLRTGTLPMHVPEVGWGATVRSAQHLSKGEVLDLVEETITRIKTTDSVLPEEVNTEEATTFLEEFRYDHWSS